MDFVIMILMFTFGIAIHVTIWTILIEHINNSPKEVEVSWPAVILGIGVLCIGSFLILTALLIMVRVATGGAL